MVAAPISLRRTGTIDSSEGRGWTTCWQGGTIGLRGPRGGPLYRTVGATKDASMGVRATRRLMGAAGNRISDGPATGRGRTRSLIIVPLRRRHRRAGQVDLTLGLFVLRGETDHLRCVGGRNIVHYRGRHADRRRRAERLKARKAKPHRGTRRRRRLRRNEGVDFLDGGDGIDRCSVRRDSS